MNLELTSQSMILLALGLIAFQLPSKTQWLLIANKIVGVLCLVVGGVLFFRGLSVS